ncbi:hypothetical protein ACN28I_25800 [Archangium gephyra]|uniref:hypothetical protein n=1 Tax=Archangium gephyra TaxID=48 RepID=UPI003B76C55A
MNSHSLFRVLATAGLSFAVTACGPQEELSSPELNPVSVASRIDGTRLSPDEARAAATASGGVTDEDVVLGITYVRPHGVRPSLVAQEVYEVPVTTIGRDGVPVRELVYVDVFDGTVVLRVPLDTDIQ